MQSLHSWGKNSEKKCILLFSKKFPLYMLVTWKEYTNMFHSRIMHILFYEQAVCRRGTKNKKKACLKNVGNIAMWLYYSLAGVRDNVYIVQRTGANRGWKWVFRIVMWHPIGP